MGFISRKNDFSHSGQLKITDSFSPSGRVLQELHHPNWYINFFCHHSGLLKKPYC